MALSLLSGGTIGSDCHWLIHYLLTVLNKGRKTESLKNDFSMSELCTCIIYDQFTGLRSFAVIILISHLSCIKTVICLQLNQLPRETIAVRNFPPPDFWSVISHILQFFKLLGILPVAFVRTKTEKNGEKLEIQFSRLGYVIAVVFLILSTIHTIWAPTTLIRLEKSIAASFVNHAMLARNVTAVLHRRTFNTKLGEVVKILHPILVSLTSLSARILSVSVQARSTTVLFKAFAQVDRLLGLPSKFYLADFGTLAGVAVSAFVLHLPVIGFHLWEIYDFHDFWENVWEGFSMLNVFTSFALELEFVLFCLSARSRFKYINELLTTFVSEEFLYDARSGGRLKRVFSKWKAFIRPRSRRVFSSRITAKEELFKLFSKMDAENGGKFLEPVSKLALVEALQRKKAPEPETCNLLRSLRSGHILLFDVLQNVNDLYQVHLLVSIFSSVTEVMFNIYFTIFGFVHSMRVVPGTIRNGEFYLITCWSVYYCFRFMLIVNVAHFTAAASKEAIKIVSKIDPRKFEFLSKQEIKMLSDHLSRRDFEFSACGLFNLNSSLISASFSTGITYLVIMAQFH